MFKKVITDKQQEIFETIWYKVCKEKGFVFEPSREFATRYILGDEIGTVEFVPYNPRVFSTVETHFSFSSLEIVQKFANKTFEIDKICLVSDKRNKGYIVNILKLMYHHYKITNTKHYIALMDLVFYRTLKVTFGLKILQVGKTIHRPAKNVIEGNSVVSIPACALVPILFDTDTLCQSIERLEWLNEESLLAL